MRDVFTIHCKSVDVDGKKNVIVALNSYWMPLETFPELHTGNGKAYH